jgi:4-diphosphocytidyl-2C-methyl-D-erythritol kinase
MSGSGATVFAVFESDAARAQAEQALSETGWWCARTRTLRRDEYQAAITVKSEVGSRKSE